MRENLKAVIFGTGTSILAFIVGSSIAYLALPLFGANITAMSPQQFFSIFANSSRLPVFLLPSTAIGTICFSSVFKESYDA